MCSAQEDDRPEPRPAPAPRVRPLAGVRVLELGQVISAPYAGLLLADLGAEVIKVEPPGTGDSARDPAVTPMGTTSATFVTFNRNKRSLALDLTEDQDRATFVGLVRSADAVLTNMVPRVARKLGVDHDTLHGINPAIITCALHGFRSEDPRSSDPSYDLTHQALSGFMTMEGREGDPPLRVCVPIADLIAAHFSVQAILAALLARAADGRGEHIEIPMYDSMLSLLTYTATLYLSGGHPPSRMGSEHEYVVPWQAVESLDGWFVLATRSEKFWARLCTAIGREEWLRDPRFATNEARLAHRDEMRALLDQTLRTREVAHWIDLLGGLGVPVAPVRSVQEALDESDAEVPGLTADIGVHDGVPVRVVGNPIRFSRLTTVSPAGAPALDELRSELPSELLTADEARA